MVPCGCHNNLQFLKHVLLSLSLRTAAVIINNLSYNMLSLNIDLALAKHCPYTTVEKKLFIIPWSDVIQKKMVFLLCHVSYAFSYSVYSIYSSIYSTLYTSYPTGWCKPGAYPRRLRVQSRVQPRQYIIIPHDTITHIYLYTDSYTKNNFRCQLAYSACPLDGIEEGGGCKNPRGTWRTSNFTCSPGGARHLNKTGASWS